MIKHRFVSPVETSTPDLVDGAEWNDAHIFGIGALIVVAQPIWWYQPASGAGLDNSLNLGTMTMPQDGEWHVPIDVSGIVVADGASFYLTATVIFNPLSGDEVPAGFSVRCYVDEPNNLIIITSQSGVRAVPAGEISFTVLVTGFIVSADL